MGIEVSMLVDYSLPKGRRVAMMASRGGNPGPGWSNRDREMETFMDGPGPYSIIECTMDDSSVESMERFIKFMESI
jgi:hypothetical protein